MKGFFDGRGKQPMTRFFRHCGYYFGYYSYMLLNMLYYMFFLPFMKPGRANFILAKKAKVFTDFMRWVIHLGFTVKGKENIPWDRPVIIVSKHQSGFEAVALQTFLPPSVFVIKKQILYIPILGLVCMGSNQIWVDRKKSNIGESLRDQVSERFKHGLSLCIFPEGTRTKPGDHDTIYKTGAAHLAQQLQVDLLPVALNTGEFFSKGFFKEQGVATFSVLPVIPWNARKSPKELMELVKENIENEQRQIEGQGPLFLDRNQGFAKSTD